MNKRYDIIYNFHKDTQLLRDTIQGEFCRICVTESKDELDMLMGYIKDNLDKLYELKEREIGEIGEIENEKIN